MKANFTITVLLFVALHPSFGQARWGIEFKGSRSNTTNNGQLLGGSDGSITYTIDNEDDLETSSQSLGVIYKLDDRNLLKFHLGSHQNGRTLTLTACDDNGQCTTYSNVTVGFRYFQLAPSYCYRVLNKKFIIPVEAGINMNIQRKENDVIFIKINEFNLDYEISTGLDYRIDSTLMVGLHGIYSGNLNEYQDKEFVNGTYKPKQLGFEFSVLYEFGKNNEKNNQ